MANYCYNHAIVYGKKEVLDEIEEKFNKYTDYDYLVRWGDMVLNKEVERNIKDDYCYYNTRWWDCIIDRDWETLLFYHTLLHGCNNYLPLLICFNYES